MLAKNLFIIHAALQLMLSVVVGKVKYPPAELCNPETLEGCQGRQAEFAEVWRLQPVSRQIQMLESLQKKIRYEDEADWLDDQIIILENVIEFTRATREEL
mmetsp:Transcript_2872/g.6154  ORF Transcript_2872/g.6154 Transcript_2872/m.6154 type:complete len:101 (-) Transcript_2872:330-632(-)|eukprot:CAMPEP_0172312900 /NCGR_PEP_ID=MMETSP1058-20130122/18764_1 /TAXON_ID=83371 /ORGANISM="Detonula confervacea, Strain CCMP 353" /LENGTH=100 /DNA_ID=CAMNT_0013026457 /DNA_START=44 /DNA_END=346 /DNA_ORIENTATION=+